MDIQTAQTLAIFFAVLSMVTAALGLTGISMAMRQSDEYRKSAEYWRSEAERLHNQLKGKL